MGKHWAKPIAHLFASGFFTALNDGKTSAILSLFRPLIFLILPLLILPKFCGIDGVWMSIPVAESLSILLSIFYFRHLKDKYHYAYKEDIIVPLLQREEQTMSAIGQTESQELIRLLKLYGKTYCEQIGSIEK